VSTKTDVQSLANLQAQVEATLWDYEPLRTLGGRWSAHALADGSIELSGVVRTRLIKDSMLAIVRDLPGAVHIVDRLIADPDLETAVARAIAMNPGTRGMQPGVVTVRSYHGRITLLGRLPAGAPRQAVLDVARAVPGVVEILDQLR